MYKQPVIVIGMHRSGTTMLSKVLEAMGIFMGYKKEINNESTYFISLNKYILKKNNATWINPKNMIKKNSMFNHQTTQEVLNNLNSFKNIEYFGFKKLLLKNFNKLNFNWGWKDPRNTFTIDIWKTIFKDAKIIHISRNPVDVAISLKKRELKFNKLNPKEKTQNFINLDSGIKLWEIYENKCLEIANKYLNSYLHIKYEDFLKNPEVELEKIYTFLGIEKLDSNRTNKIISKLDTKRAYAFYNDKKIKKLFIQKYINNSTVKKLGYDKTYSSSISNNF